MATSILDVKEIMPEDGQVLQALGGLKKLWDSVKDFFNSKYENTKEEWKFYSKKAGWSLLLKQKDRTIFYLIPCKSSFKVSFVFGEKAVAKAMESGIDNGIKQLIQDSTPYTEGRPFMVEVIDEAIIPDLKTLIGIKIDN